MTKVAISRERVKTHFVLEKAEIFSQVLLSRAERAYTDMKAFSNEITMGLETQKTANSNELLLNESKPN